MLLTIILWFYPAYHLARYHAPVRGIDAEIQVAALLNIVPASMLIARHGWWRLGFLLLVLAIFISMMFYSWLFGDWGLTMFN